MSHGKNVGNFCEGNEKLMDGLGRFKGLLGRFAYCFEEDHPNSKRQANAESE